MKNLKFEVLRWDDVIRLSFKLARKIIISKFKPDAIVALLRGGLVPARILSDVLGVYKLFIVGVAFYVDVGVHASRPIITQPLNANLSGSNILIVDDVADTGRSLIVAKEHVKSLGAGSIKIATLHKKPWSEIEPDYFVCETDAWIVYPWEYIEAAKSLESKLLLENLSEDEKERIANTLQRIRDTLKLYENHSPG